jgi:hypothetical protein
MTLDLDTFLPAVYCMVDDRYRARYRPVKPARPGHRPELSDSEVLTLAVLGQWHPRGSERGFLRFVRQYWSAYFPRLLSQNAFNRRVRDLAGVLCDLVTALDAAVVDAVGTTGGYQVLDGVPVPLASRCRGGRHRLFADSAAFGVGGSDKDWFYGIRLLACIRPIGTVSGFVYGPANTGERWLLEALVRWREHPTAPVPTAAELAPVLGPSHHGTGRRLGPTGPIGGRCGAGTPSPAPYLADCGFTGTRWARHWNTAYGATVLTKADYRPGPQQRAARHWLSRHRQTIETAFGWLTDFLGLARPRAKTDWGLLARLGAKLAAFNLGVWINYQFGRPPFAFFNPLG